jgi:ABC-type branched-subunit amino acid transport system substrate-binding protein
VLRNKASRATKRGPKASGVTASGASQVVRAARKTTVTVATALCLALELAACGGTTTTGATSSHATLVFDNIAPFTGPNAAFGPGLMAGCWTAVGAINNAGGVLGHKFTCIPTDTRGDPADAVPAVRLMLAKTKNLVGISGPSSDSAIVLSPILDEAHVPAFEDTGQALFDHSTDPYFYRIVPADDTTGFAMAAYAFHRGYRKAAFVFSDDLDAQGNKPSAVAGWERLGGKVVANINLALDQPSYTVEASQIARAHPNVIITEMDPQSASTFLRDYQQIAQLPAIVGSTVTLQAQWLDTVAKAIGKSNLQRVMAGIRQYTTPSGPAWTAYYTALHAVASKIQGGPGQYNNDPYNEAYYDAFNIMALAMVMAKTTDPSKWNADITKVTNPNPGAVIVSTYAQGLHALKQGKSIRYVGASGAVDLDQYHNSSGVFAAYGYNPALAQPVRLLAILTPGEINAARK